MDISVFIIVRLETVGEESLRNTFPLVFAIGKAKVTCQRSSHRISSYPIPPLGSPEISWDIDGQR